MVEEWSVGGMMQAAATDAINWAREGYGMTLDYSVESLQNVEKILAALRGTMTEQKPSEQQIQDVCMILGGYIGEVFRRQWGGEWLEETPVEMFKGRKMITLSVGGLYIWPPSKVHKRLIEGEENNIPYYYVVFSKQIEDNVRNMI